MVLACILVYCDAGRREEVLEAVKSIKYVEKAFETVGRCDVVVKVDAPTLEDVGVAAYEVARQPGVRATETLIETIM